MSAPKVADSAVNRIAATIVVIITVKRIPGNLGANFLKQIKSRRAPVAISTVGM